MSKGATWAKASSLQVSSPLAFSLLAFSPQVSWVAGVVFGLAWEAPGGASARAWADQAWEGLVEEAFTRASSPRVSIKVSLLASFPLASTQAFSALVWADQA